MFFFHIAQISNVSHSLWALQLNSASQLCEAIPYVIMGLKHCDIKEKASFKQLHRLFQWLSSQALVMLEKHGVPQRSRLPLSTVQTQRKSLSLIIRTYGICKSWETVGMPFFMASGERMDSSTVTTRGENRKHMLEGKCTYALQRL